MMVFAPPQHGKLLPASTPVLTTQGFKNHGDLKKGDFVFNQNGEPCKVLANSGCYEWEVCEMFFLGWEKNKIVLRNICGQFLMKKMITKVGGWVFLKRKIFLR